MSKLIHVILIVLVSVLTSYPTLAQNNQQFNDLTTPESTQNWMTFKTDAQNAAKQLKVDNLVKIEKKALSLGKDDALFLAKNATTKDKLGYKHHRFQQTYKNITVEGAIFLVHEKDGVAKKANGYLVKQLAVNTKPTLSEAEALQRALASVAAKQYAWQNETFEKALQQTTQNVAVTYYPKGELRIISPITQFKQTDAYKLTYKFDIYATDPLSRAYIYVDAHTGTIVESLNRIHDTDVAGTGTSNYACNNPVALTCKNNFYYPVYNLLAMPLGIIMVVKL